MKLSISNIAWDEEENEKMYEYLKERHFDLEIAPTKIVKDRPYEHLTEAKQYVDALKEKYQIQISSMQSIWFGRTENIFESEENRQALIEYTKKAIDFAQKIHCPNLVFGSPKNRNMSQYEKDYPIALAFFKEIGEYALEKGVVVAVEPNPTIYHTNFLNETKDAIDFVKQIDLNSIKVNYDLGTVIENKEDLEQLKNNLTYIHHIHISEPNLVPIEKRELHQKLFQILREENYQNYVSIEMKQTSIEVVQDTIDYVLKLSR